MGVTKFQECHCWWCEFVQIPYLHKLTNDLYWFEIPKNASTAIKVRYDGRHLVNREKYSELNKCDIAPVVVWRDPIDRFVSLLNHYLYRSGPWGRFNKGQRLFHPIDIEELSPEERIGLLFVNLENLSTVHEVHHWFPQTDFIDTETFKHFTMVHIDEVGTMFDLPKEKVNPSDQNITEDMLTSLQIGILEHLYRKDYEFLEEQGVS